VRASEADETRPRLAVVPAWRVPAAVAAGVVGAGMFVAATLSLTHGGEGVAGVLAALLRFARYLGSLVAAGGFVFMAVVRPPATPLESRGRRLVLLAVAVAATASVVAVPVQAAYLTGQAAAAVDGSVLAAVVASGFGRSVAVGLAGLALLAAAVARVPAPAAGGAGAAGSLLALGAFLLTGHSVVSEPQSVALPANLAHAAAGAVWLGGLVLLPLALAERREADDLVGGARLVGRFSTAATLVLVAVGAAGLALAWVEVRALAALATSYGVVLLIKAALVGVVAALGLYNNRRLVPAIRCGDIAGWGRLLRIVRLEAVGLVGVVAVTAVLVNIVPARVEAGVDAQVVGVAPLGADRVATVIVEPARPGANEVHVFVEGGALGEELADLTLRLVPPGEEEAAETVTPTRVGPGHWLHLGPEFTHSGAWQLQLAGKIGDAEETVTMTIPIAPSDEWSDL
jgi:copper transport protein